MTFQTKIQIFDKKRLTTHDSLATLSCLLTMDFNACQVVLVKAALTHVLSGSTLVLTDERAFVDLALGRFASASATRVGADAAGVLSTDNTSSLGDTSLTIFGWDCSNDCKGKDKDGRHRQC